MDGRNRTRVKDGRVRNVLLMTLAIQLTLLVVVTGLSFPLLHLAVALTLFVVGHEAFWLLELHKAIDW